MTTLHDDADRVNPADLRDDEDHAALWHDTLDAVAAFEPTEADRADYIAWCRQRDERLLAERMTVPPLEDWLRTEADRYRYLDPSPHSEWLAARLVELAERANYLGATTGEVFDDRLAALMESVEARYR